MNRSGFALLAVLWVLTALTALTAVGVSVARLGTKTTANRVLLARAEWAREACGEILQARFAGNAAVREVDPIELGRGTWCRASVDDPAARLNLNTASQGELARLFRAVHAPQALVDSVIAQRRQGALHHLRQVRGLDSSVTERLASVVTTRGTGVVNVNAAPPEVLRLLPGMSEESVVLILSRRGTRSLRSADELAGLLSRFARSVFLANYAEFARSAVFAPPQLVATVEGGVRGSPIVARATLTMVPVPGRLAVIRRETE